MTRYDEIIEYINRISADDNLSKEASKSLEDLEIEIGVLCDDVKKLEKKVEELSTENLFLTIPEATKVMKIGRRKLDEIIKNNEIPIIRYTSKTILLDMKNITKYIESKKTFYQNKEVQESVK
ncbi:hypothetical protein BKH42_03470 [Helicobacter sp. 13S00482-2]|uniref:hypothetical protein n=1 Tax=Helicobacter sp. 13S00482-2 TaxID=1476200 RepID=UPI000BA5D562|nr:hypothetical protein [Helicobacter sp. 13S00482-2]PAF53800.1 hypothetical protein BKH42_03470 [Helicobacter sp. 13S00482-2]